MNRRSVKLTERRTRSVKLPRAEVNFLLAHARHILDVIPDHAPRTYRLTPRGYVGFFDGPTTRYAIGPKIPWPNLCMLLGISREHGGDAVEAEGGLLAALADEFATRLEAATRTGLVAGYGMLQSVAPYLRGKLRTADQIRETAAGAFPDHFHIDEPVFDLNTPWHRIAKATACELLRRELPRATRQRIEAATEPLATMPEVAVTDADFITAFAESRATSYLPLLHVCRLILNGLNSADPHGISGNAFLINLGRVFERYLFTSLTHELVAKASWRVEEHRVFHVGPTELQPDILLRYNGTPAVVLDAKWKTDTSEIADLHQVLAYATVTGAPRVGLVFPGRSDGRTRFLTPDGRVQVSLYRLRVVGTAAQLAASVKKFARIVRKG